MKKKQTAEEKEKRLKEFFYRTYPEDGMLGLHGVMSEDLYVSKKNHHKIYQQIPQRQLK